MPIYEYEHDESVENPCCERFEYIQPISADSLSECPHCGQPVHRVFSGFAVNKSTKDILSKKNIEEKGFTQYKRAGKGVYEKTAGHGPQIIKE